MTSASRAVAPAGLSWKECRLCHRIGSRGFVLSHGTGWLCANDRACAARERRAVGGAVVRVQLSRQPGARKPRGAVVVSRPGRWGNPFQLVRQDRSWSVWVGQGINHHRVTPWHDSKTAASAAAVRLYSEWLDGDRSRETSTPPARWEIRMHLRGTDLACWCPLVGAAGNRFPCHGDELINRANDRR